MKVLRATARVAPEDAPTFFNLLAHAPEVEEARVLEVNTTPAGVETLLIAIDGDHTAFAAQADETPGVQSVEVSVVGEGRAYALLVMRSPETPLFDRIHEMGSSRGFVVRTPFVYRDGAMYGRAVGDPEPLQRALEEVPAEIDVRVDEVGEFRGGLDDPGTRLSERQREALETARDLGYYETPREATHEDVAAELDCAPATASDHLQKAEAKLVDAALDEFGPEV
ncbi:helix-turn-helix domain-containing protein [Halosimplex halobium]|uniref:helix-turn-helix domain-containing protein n=1 Tax=Halosimplex halobium TaxID=3396618 RepID=UPI003F55CA31